MREGGRETFGDKEHSHVRKGFLANEELSFFFVDGLIIQINMRMVFDGQ